MNKKVLFAIVSIIAILGIVTIFIVRQALLFSEAMGCEDEILSEIQAENKEHSAYLISRQCGATAPNTFQVFVLTSKAKHDFESNNPIAIVEENTAPSLTWIDNHHLKVVLDPNSKIHKQDLTILGIDVNYKFNSSPD